MNLAEVFAVLFYCKACPFYRACVDGARLGVWRGECPPADTEIGALVRRFKMDVITEAIARREMN